MLEQIVLVQKRGAIRSSSSVVLRTSTVTFSSSEQHTRPDIQCLVGSGIPFDHRVTVSVAPALAKVGVQVLGNAHVQQAPVGIPPETPRIEKFSPEPQTLDPILSLDVMS